MRSTSVVHAFSKRPIPIQCKVALKETSADLCRDITPYAHSMAVETRCLFALGVVVLHFVEFSRPDRLPGVSTNAILQTSRPHTSLCWSLMFFLKYSESGPLLGPSCLPSFAVAEPTDEEVKIFRVNWQPPKPKKQRNKRSQAVEQPLQLNDANTKALCFDDKRAKAKKVCMCHG